MAGTKTGGQKAAATNLERDPDFYKKIGAKGGRNGRTGGFADMTPCHCEMTKVLGSHHKAQCVGRRGGQARQEQYRTRRQST
jgi:general stress protein YciG